MLSIDRSYNLTPITPYEKNTNPSTITVYSSLNKGKNLYDLEEDDKFYNKSTFSGHFYITTSGKVIAGRPLDAVGEFAYDKDRKYNLNYHNIGICVEGDFEKDFLQDTQKLSLLLLFDYLKSKFSNKMKMFFLREFDYGENPGRLFPFGEIGQYFYQGFPIQKANVGGLRFDSFGSRELYITNPLTTGTDVYTLQTILNKLGYYKSVPNGIYDYTTKACIINYQLDNGLIGSGIAGNKTLIRLENDMKKAYSSKEFKRVLELENGNSEQEGPDVLTLQKCLVEKRYTCKLTGLYDTETARAVTEFQKDNNLVQDGKVGPITWNFIINSKLDDEFRDLYLNYDNLLYGEDVRKLQEKLSSIGYRVPITEKYDVLTEQMVILFQKRNNLTPNGRVTIDVWNLIFSK